MLAAYYKTMSDSRYAQSSVRGVNSAVRDLYRHDLVNTPTASSLVKSVIKAAAKLAPPVKVRDPLTRQHILKILRTNHEHQTAAFTRNFFMLLLAYRSFLRGSEITALRVEDVFLSRCTKEDEQASHFPVAMHGVELLILRVSSSKTNPQSQKAVQDRTGDTVMIGPDSNALIDPIRWFKLWSNVRHKQSEFLFHSWNLNNPKPMHCKAFNEVVKSLASHAGLSADYYITGHSTRSGGTTDAIRAGVDLRLVKKHGRWKSNAVFLYIRDDVGASLVINAALGQMDSAPSTGSTHPPIGSAGTQSTSSSPQSTLSLAPARSATIVSLTPARIATAIKPTYHYSRPKYRIETDNDPFPAVRTYARPSIAVDVPSPPVAASTPVTSLSLDQQSSSTVNSFYE